MGERLTFFSKKQGWNTGKEEENSEITALISETIARIPENSLTKLLGIDQLAKAIMDEAIETIFRALVVDYSDIFSENIEEREIQSVIEDLQMQLVEVLECYAEKSTSEEFVKTCQALFGGLNIKLELAANNRPKHLYKSIAEQVVKELVFSARTVINSHRCDYLCKIANTCEYRDQPIEWVKTMRQPDK